MKFLVIQTAFIGDVILATALAEKLHAHYPQASIAMLVRKGNEALLEEHPFIKQVFVWDKKQNKVKNLFSIALEIRNQKFTHVINLQRFASSGIITALSGAKSKIGFDKNPLSVFYSHKATHTIGNGTHEVERNQLLIAQLTDAVAAKPVLYPTASDFSSVQRFKQKPYICIAPTSVWFTKQWPANKWIELIQLNKNVQIYLLGAPSDFVICDRIREESKHPLIENLSGKLSFLESATLMKDAQMNYVNDSAPMHMASAMNAPVTAVFCSTIPGFGFGPISSVSRVIETSQPLKCRPCGLHGHAACPQKHFKCALEIPAEKVLYQR